MPSKNNENNVNTKRDSATTSLYDPFDEFKILFEVQPVLRKLENVFKELEIKY